jgi:hypothetical protein
MGGKTLGVYAPGTSNYNNAAELQEQGRVNSIAPADYSEGSAPTCGSRVRSVRLLTGSRAIGIAHWLPTDMLLAMS